jgi:hypothetical protein
MTAVETLKKITEKATGWARPALDDLDRLGLAIEGDRGVGEILRGDRRAGIKESGVPGVARSRQGYQDNKEACALG